MTLSELVQTLAESERVREYERITDEAKRRTLITNMIIGICVESAKKGLEDDQENEQ
jgi:hypothetical protein